MARLLTKKGFKEWLAKQPDNRRAACNDARRCVLAQYLADTHGGVVEVLGDEFVIRPTAKASSTSTYYNLPVWAKNVVEEFDNIGLVDGSGQVVQRRYSQIREALNPIL